MNLNMTEFNKYSLKKHFIMNILNNIPQIKKKIPAIKTQISTISKKKEADTFFYPDTDFNDTLFWCYKLFTEGFKNYEYSRNSVFQTEKTEKIILLSKLKKHKDLLKKHKFKMTTLEDELVQQNEITMYSFNALLLINKIYELLDRKKVMLKKSEYEVFTTKYEIFRHE